MNVQYVDHLHQHGELYVVYTFYGVAVHYTICLYLSLSMCLCANMPTQWEATHKIAYHSFSVTAFAHYTLHLSVRSMLHHFNNDGLTSHEGELHHNPLLYHLGIHHQTITDVLQCAQENVCAKEGLSMADSPAKGVSPFN